MKSDQQLWNERTLELAEAEHKIAKLKRKLRKVKVGLEERDGAIWALAAAITRDNPLSECEKLTREFGQ